MGGGLLARQDGTSAVRSMRTASLGINVLSLPHVLQEYEQSPFHIELGSVYVPFIISGC